MIQTNLIVLSNLEFKPIIFTFGHLQSAIAQLVERMTVNHDVAGSNPAGGVAVKTQKIKLLTFFPSVLR